MTFKEMFSNGLRLNRYLVLTPEKNDTLVNSFANDTYITTGAVESVKSNQMLSTTSILYSIFPREVGENAIIFAGRLHAPCHYEPVVPACGC